MKPLHTSSQVTASDSRMVVRVGELSTPDGPVRRIVVTADAEMSPDEVRELRTRLNLAIAIAESPNPTMPCWCIADDPCRCPGRESIKDCPCYRHGVANHEPAVSEDQPKPRVWHKGDPEPIESGLQLRSDDGLTWFRKPNGEWKNDAAWGALWPAVLHYAGELSEVLADSEQATR